MSDASPSPAPAPHVVGKGYEFDEVRSFLGGGIKLAETRGPLPVYVRRTEGGQWFYNGLYEVTSHTTDPTIIRPRLMPPKIVAIDRLVFLKRCSA
ncbi:MAG: hypothetical protein EBV31_07680 [Verrucomicrobia bacterium]|nr:hypothetical protein [Verrucomicrobiota bacterium]